MFEGRKSVLTFVYANFLKAFLASDGSKNSITAVTPEGGKIMFATEPFFENRSCNSSADVPEGRFLANITVLLLGPVACFKVTEIRIQITSLSFKGFLSCY